MAKCSTLFPKQEIPNGSLDLILPLVFLLPGFDLSFLHKSFGLS
ncbi:hypothetical protein XBKQ1_1360005 [Xenorhabdus bovienii str. kraussei Quebec]|uniref:Uncharacterized protein n=1 Tax=Xenorhabdus bovienii str. kraussei Quebec TaxID=1398203 RepID=A0A077PD39_XENBV|nr:hypothetical protein XBKQ1_1360005 [Xenorhabdus bovienii str. kraussei Quebec]